jgi:hypothetical protein
MMQMAVMALTRAGRAAGRPYLLVAEPESTDNFGNSNNAIGTLVSLKVADDMIGVALQTQERGSLLWSPLPTTVLTAADSDASGMQLRALRAATANVTTVGVNPAAGQLAVSNLLDGLYGRGTQSFAAEPDQFGRVHHFGIAWAGTPDFAGGILARASSGRGNRGLTLTSASGSTTPTCTASRTRGCSADCCRRRPPWRRRAEAAQAGARARRAPERFLP